MEVAQIIDSGRQPAGNGESALKGRLAEREMEDGLLVGDVRLPIGAGHGQLVEIGEQSERGRREIGVSGTGIHLASVTFAPGYAQARANKPSPPPSPLPKGRGGNPGSLPLRRRSLGPACIR